MNTDFCLLAQGTPPAGFVVNAWWLLVAALGGLASWAVIYSVFFRKKEVRKLEPDPLNVEADVRVVPKGRRFNAHEYDERNKTVDKRLDGHDGEIGKLWDTLRAEDAATRQSLEAAVRDFDQTVNRIDGTLQQVNKVQEMLLNKLLKDV